MLPCADVMQPPDTASNLSDGVLVQHRVSGFSDHWLVGEEPVPEAAWHDRALRLLTALLEHWVARTRRDATIFRNLAVRVRQDRPAVGFDPDLMVVEPAPPDAMELSSLRLWEPGHAVPAVVIEVVSPGHPYKDYSEIPDKCAAIGVAELIVFDPLLVGPKAAGGPQRIQLWARTDGGAFERVAAGDGPFPSSVLGGYVVARESGRELLIAEDPGGDRLWMTAEQQERTLKEQERTLKESALARVAELEARLQSEEQK